MFSGTLGYKPSETIVIENFIHENGSLYRLDEDSQIHKLDAVTLANGLAWDIERKYFYYVDSMDAIRRYDYDIETGNICKLLLINYVWHFGLTLLYINLVC